MLLLDGCWIILLGSKAVVLGFAELGAFLLAHERWGGRYGSGLFEPTSI